MDGLSRSARGTADSSNIDHAANLRGKLFLMVGELDTNVPPESTLRLADALIKAGKDFDLLVLPGLDHTSGGAYGERRRRDYFLSGTCSALSRLTATFPRRPVKRQFC